MITSSTVSIDAPADLVWNVFTDVVPQSSWTWVQHSPGGVTTARHDVVETAEGTTVVRQELDQRGIVGAAVAVLMRRTTRRYLAMEGDGLKARCEELRNLRGPVT